MNYDLTYISLGGGRQSTALAICSALGLHGIPKADVAIFADTGDEVADTYEHFESFGPWLQERGIPLEIVKHGHLGVDMMSGSRSFIPAFVESKTTPAPLFRKCTQEYKGDPIDRRAKELLGNRSMAGALIGISLDEAHRMKPSKLKWVDRLYPLVDSRLRVEDCMRICKDHLGYVPIKSACRFCPYHDNVYWRWLKNERPDEFEKAAKVDDGIRDLSRAGVKMPAYLHRSLKPLREIDFEDRSGQTFIAGFGNDCEGVCGV